MGQLPNFAFHVGIWFRYDQFGSNSYRPLLGAPQWVDALKSIPSSYTFWPFPKCLKMVIFGEIRSSRINGGLRWWEKDLWAASLALHPCHTNSGEAEEKATEEVRSE